MCVRISTIGQKKRELINELPDNERKKIDNLRKVLNDLNKYVHPNAAVQEITTHVLTETQEFIGQIQERGMWCENKNEEDEAIRKAGFAVRATDNSGKLYSVLFQRETERFNLQCTKDELSAMLQGSEKDFPKAAIKKFIEVTCKGNDSLFFVKNAELFTDDVDRCFEELSNSAKQTVITQFSKAYGFKDFTCEFLVSYLTADRKWLEQPRDAAEKFREMKIADLKPMLDVGAPYVASYNHITKRYEISILENEKVTYIALSPAGFLEYFCKRNFDPNKIRADIGAIPMKGEAENKKTIETFKSHHAKIQERTTALERLQSAFAIQDIVTAATQNKGKKEDYKELVAVILKVNKDDDAAIKKAYRKLGFLVHPINTKIDLNTKSCFNFSPISCQI